VVSNYYLSFQFNLYMSHYSRFIYSKNIKKILIEMNAIKEDIEKLWNQDGVEIT